MDVPYVNLSAQHAAIKPEILAAVGHVIDSGQFILGDDVAEFECRFADLCGVRYAVGVNSGTDALMLALRAVGVGPGDEVITAPNSFVATASSITLLGARPVFVDVGEDYNISPELIRDAITSRTRVVLPVHLTGRPAEMNPILEIAHHHHLQVIEDCAQAVIAEYHGRRVGSLGTIGCFSFHPLKTLNACGDGGMLTTNDADLAARFRIMRNIGLKSRDNCVVWSGNSRLDTMQAAILSLKLSYLEGWTAKRRANAEFYRSRLSAMPQIQFPPSQPHLLSVYHTFVIQADNRDDLRRYLAGKGIGTAIHYPVPIHLHEAAAHLGYKRGSFPVAERQAQRILSLPVYPELNEMQLQYVADCIRTFYEAR
jgi:dTDP-4-amino-4,6-dideoxygalactose transaminase